MTTRTITLKLPEGLYQRLKARADQAQRSIEDVVLDVLAASLTVADQLPEDLAA